MQTTRRELLNLVLIGLCSLAAVRAGAQVEGTDGDSGGTNSQPHTEGIDRAQSSGAPAGRLITLTLHQATMKEALRAVARQADVRLIYNDSDLPADRLVTATISDATVEQALAVVLRGTELRARHIEGGIAIEPRALRERSDRRALQGQLGGLVTDATNGRPIAGVVVRLEEASLTTNTGSEGTYRFPAVPAGTYTLTARQVGYERLVRAVVVTDGGEERSDLAMIRTPTILDQVVTTGTLIPTEAKAIPTPISVISADQIAQQHAFTIMAIIRQAVPTAVAHDAPNVPANSDISVRGASSLYYGTGDMKIFVDGVEASSFGQSPVDPASIDRIEVIRGPQAATLYGADAAGGVIQIFTKRGDPALARPQVNARVELGSTQTPYAGFSHVLRQQYSASVKGGAPDISYRFGGGYKRLADYAPRNGPTAQSSSSVYGGMNFSRGILTTDLTARYYRNAIPQASNPDLASTGYPYYTQPAYTRGEFTNETYGARAILSPVGWWRNQLTVGIDRFGIANVQTRPRYTTPADTLLRLAKWSYRKLSVGYNTTVAGAVSHSMSGSLTLGLDQYVQLVTNLSAPNALATSGTITTAPAGRISYSDNSITNKGYFAQAQLALRDALFVTLGIRAEDNASFGKDYGLATLPRVGVSFVKPLGVAMLKLRASYGASLRTPSPNQATGRTGTSSVQLANPDLAPERQKGWDGGIDLVMGRKGSLSISGFDQTALDLIAYLTVATTPVVAHRFQNIGRVSNKGIELEGAFTPTASIAFRAQYGYVRSRIEEVGSAGGQVAAGDPPVEVPAHTAGAAITITPRNGTTINTGLTYVGSFNGMDWLTELRCLASGTTDACPPSYLDKASLRDFIVRYPGFAKINVSVVHSFSPHLDAFIAVDNLTNNTAFEFDNSVPQTGRTMTGGLEVSF
jgi:outer membrane receptor protein involved in Fe transport